MRRFRLAGALVAVVSVTRGAHAAVPLPPLAPLPGGLPEAAPAPGGDAPPLLVHHGAGARRTCGAVDKPPGQVALEAHILRTQGVAQTVSDFNLTVPVKFHVMCYGSVYRVPLSNIVQQIAVLNAAYGATSPVPRGGPPTFGPQVDTGIRFTLDEVVYHDALADATIPSAWVTGCSTTTGAAIARQLSSNPERFLNVFTCNPSGGLLGWVLGFPQDAPESDTLHSVFVLYSSLPGMVAPSAGWPYGLGNTLVHETGHYFGLYHTFQGGCGPVADVTAGDAVDDTPCEASPAYGTVADVSGRDTCTGAGQSDAATGPWHGLDPWSSYLDYTDDAAMWQFSAGQAARMQVMTQVYKPALYAAYGGSGQQQQAQTPQTPLPPPPPAAPAPPSPPGIPPSLVLPASPPQTSLFATF